MFESHFGDELVDDIGIGLEGHPIVFLLVHMNKYGDMNMIRFIENIKFDGGSEKIKQTAAALFGIVAAHQIYIKEFKIWQVYTVLSELNEGVGKMRVCIGSSHGSL